MKTSLSQFCAYLEKLATLNTDIAHTPESPAFHLFYAAESIESKLRSLINRVPCILVKDYDFRFETKGADNLHKIRSVEMIVVDKLGRNESLADVYNVWEQTELIGDELIMRMRHDKHNRVKEVINFDLNNVQGVPANLTFLGLFGTMYSIPIGNVQSNDPDPLKWTDLTE